MGEGGEIDKEIEFRLEHIYKKDKIINLHTCTREDIDTHTYPPPLPPIILLRPVGAGGGGGGRGSRQKGKNSLHCEPDIDRMLIKIITLMSASTYVLELFVSWCFEPSNPGALEQSSIDQNRLSSHQPILINRRKKSMKGHLFLLCDVNHR